MIYLLVFLIRLRFQQKTELLLRPFDKIDMTLGQGRKPKGAGKNGHIKVIGKRILYIIHAICAISVNSKQ